MKRDPMDAMTDLRGRVRHEFRVQTLVDRSPCFAAVISPKRARGRDRDEHLLLIFWINQNRMETHSACAGLPTRAGVVLAQTGKFTPCFAAIFRFKKRRVF